MEQLKILEFQGFKNIFIALCKSKEQYYIMYGNIEEPHIYVANEEITTEFWSFNCMKNISVNIPFMIKSDELTHFIMIDKPEEYKQILTILEDII